MNLSVLYSQDLSDFAKILYFEIENLAKKKGFCYATRDYFASKFQKSPNHINKILRELKEKNFIQNDKKVIKLIIKNDTEIIKNDTEIIKNDTKIIKNDTTQTYYMNSEIKTPKFEKENLKENFEIAKNENSNFENQKIENSKSENFNSLEKIKIPAFLDFEVWDRFCKYRNEINKPMREMEAVNLFAIWSAWDKDGISVNECILQSMANGWKIVYRLDHAKKRTTDLTADELIQTQNLGFNPDFATESEKALFRYMQEQAEQGKINDKGEIYAITATR